MSCTKYFFWWRLEVSLLFYSDGCVSVSDLCGDSSAVLVTGCPSPMTSHLFPINFLCMQPMARCPAWSQIKQWRQLTLLCCTQSHLPLVSEGTWGWFCLWEGVPMCCTVGRSYHPLPQKCHNTTVCNQSKSCKFTIDYINRHCMVSIL